ncbi:site-specific DNA-methyltransferase [Empedobacter falsenii]
MEKINELTSENIVQQNIERLKEIFPTAFSEGKLVVEELQALVGEYIEENKEFYQMTWAGKTQAQKEANKVSTATLRPNKKDSKDWDTTGNIFIEGDNLEVLKLLQKTYNNKIKMIYIDPPYNTGKDFVYKDNYKDNLSNYLELTGQTDEEGKKLSTNTDSDGRYHSNWLNMMYPRLKLARNLMTDDGVIFISIDDNEQANLKKMCDEIFGEENFLGEIIWETATDNNASQISVEHEYILCFSKNKTLQKKWQIKSEKSKLIQKKYEELLNKGIETQLIAKDLKSWISSMKKSNDIDLSGVSHYSYVDDKGVYYPGNPNNTKPGDYLYEIIHPITKLPCKLPSNGWRWPLATFKQADEIGDVEWGKDHNTIPKIKKRLNTATELLKSYYYEDNRKTTNMLNNLLEEKVFENPKSLNLIQKLLKFTTKNNDLILDFFAGSGTTAHAVMALNAEDGGNRKCISVQLPEPTDEKSKAFKVGYITIAEITKERIRRAGELIKQENKDKEGIDKLDVGFRAFKLDSSNIQAWDTSIDKFEDQLEMQLENDGDNIKSERTEEDVLFEILLKYGLDLTLPIQEKEIDNCTIYNIGFGSMFICLSPQINVSVAKAIGEWSKEFEDHNPSVIFKDSGFANDADKTNTVQTLRQAGIENVKSI